jgi:hypothetical protein
MKQFLLLCIPLGVIAPSGPVPVPVVQDQMNIPFENTLVGTGPAQQRRRPPAGGQPSTKEDIVFDTTDDKRPLQTIQRIDINSKDYDLDHYYDYTGSLHSNY